MQAPSPSQRQSAFAYVARYRGRVAVGIVFLLLTSGMAMAIPWLLKLAIEALRRPEGARHIAGYAIAMIALAIGQGAFRVASRLLMFDAARTAEYDLRNDVFRHLLRLSPSFFRRSATGDVMSRLTQDMPTLRAMWGPGILNAVSTAVTFATAIALMARISGTLTVVALAPFPLVVFAGRYFGRHFFRLSREIQERLGAMSASAQEDLAGIGVVKSYTLEAARGARFADLSDEYRRKTMSLTRARGRVMPVFGVLASLSTVAVLWVGGRAVAAGEMSLGGLVAIQAYLALLTWPTLAIGWLLSLFQRGLASWGRVQALLGEVPTIADGDGPPLVPAAIRGGLEVRGLDVTLDGRRILDGVSFRVPPGSVCAIVGRTGSGKSTLVEAILRLLEVPAGAVTLDGRDVTTLPLASLRAAFGYAPQDPFLFSATIAENIAFGQPPGQPPEAVRAAVDRAARAAGLGRDLAAFPAGLDTLVGERGITLSGGQRQRVALARALVAGPPILVLDDSLSSVDARTEREILTALGAEAGGRTTLIISHRVAAVAGADQIVVLDGGRVAEIGTHAALAAAGGLYASLYREQLLEEEAA